MLSLSLLVLIPLGAAILMALIPSRCASWVFEAIHLASVVLSALLAACVIAQHLMGRDLYAWGLWLHLDTAGALFVALITIVGLAVGVYSLPYIRHEYADKNIGDTDVKLYYSLYSFFIFTMLLAVCTNNIIMMWVAVEATTLSTVFLVGLYRNRHALEAAWKYVIICTVGVAFGLYASVLVYANASVVLGSSDNTSFFTVIYQHAQAFDPRLMALAFVFAVVGFGTKAGLMPMHTWLPDAHSEAPSPVSALLSGVLLKCAILVIIRFYMLVSASLGEKLPRLILVALGLLSVALGAFFIYRQKDFKRKLAYSSSENVGIIVLCLGLGGPIGVVAALVHSLAHGLTKALLFCLSGNLLIKYKTRDLEKISGVVQVAPITAALCALGLLALSGFPPFALFWSEIMLMVSAVKGGFIWLAIVLGLVLTVVVAAFALVINRSLLRKAPQGMVKKELPALMLVPELALLAVVLLAGLFAPEVLINLIQQAAAEILSAPVL